jgi:predicted dehydrogenase
MNSENIVALCDVDWKYSEKCFKEFPNAKRFWDWRKMFDEMGNSIDAVMVATADHTHAAIAAHALSMGKHVYCQKPLTHSVYESRLADQTGCKTQSSHSNG